MWFDFSRRALLRASLPLLLSKLYAQEPTFSSAAS